MCVNTLVRRIRECVVLGAFAALCVTVFVGCGDRDTILVIEKPTEVRSIVSASPAQDSSSGVQPGNVIATLKAGETVKAIGVYHGQDSDGFKVMLVDGTEGLIIAGDTFKAMSK